MSLRRQPHSIISGFLGNNYLNVENLLYVDNHEPYCVTEKSYMKLWLNVRVHSTEVTVRTTFFTINKIGHLRKT